MPYRNKCLFSKLFVSIFTCLKAKEKLDKYRLKIEANKIDISIWELHDETTLSIKKKSQ